VLCNGVISEWIGTATDIEEARQTSDELAAALAEQRELRAEAERANRAKDEFLALLSHELRTPLNAIMGWAHMLRDGLPEEMARHAVDVISRNARSQKQLVEDLLDVARIAGGRLDLEPTEIDVRDVARAAVDAALPLARQKCIELSLVCPSSPLTLRADGNRLQQVSSNLLSNALKFTDRGGRVRVLVADASDGAMELAVEDTGAGIEPDFIPFIFERFRQADASLNRSHGGLGLGLWVVKQIVEAHGGVVWAESDGPGQGTIVRVQIPRAERC
jgi:signal transduction histidine kinase